MKKVLMLSAVLLLGVGVAFSVPTHYTETLPAGAPNGAVPLSNGYDWTVTTSTSNNTGITLTPFTLTQLQSLQPNTTGQIVYCTNCVSATVCVSSGSTAVYQWVVVSSNTTGTQCK